MFKKSKAKFLLIVLFVTLGITVFAAETDTEKNNKKAEQLKGDIIFSAPSGTFQGSLTVTLGSKIAGSQIRYTTDGTVPNGNSRLYNNPLTFSSTTQLRAQSFVNGTLEGDMGSAVYVACSINPTHDLPLLIIDGYGAGKPDREYQDCAIIVIEKNGQNTSLTQTPAVATRGGYHLRGQSSANFEKAPYRLELWDNEDDDEKYDLFGMGADGDWAILGPFVDKSLVRTALAYETGYSLNLLAPEYKYVEVYINQTNGYIDQSDYQGVYLLVETIEQDNDRIDIAKLKDIDVTEPEITGGYIMQFNMMAAEEPLIIGNGWNDLEVKDPDDLVPQQLSWITNYIQNTHDAIHNGNYPTYIDADSFVDYIILNELGRQGDSYIRSTYIYKDKNELLKAGPLWDYNLAFACSPSMGMNNVEGWQYEPFGGMPGFGVTCDWYNTLMQYSAFLNKVKARWRQLRRDRISNQQMRDRVDSLANPLANGAASRNFQKWPNLGTSYISMFTSQTTNSWAEQVQIVKDFLVDRANWIDNSWGTALPGTPQPSPTPTPTPSPSNNNIGDVNNDGRITIIDALQIAQYYVGYNPTNFDASKADVNNDGRITIIDALQVAQYYVGLITSFSN
jgi:hypothetical protein